MRICGTGFCSKGQGQRKGSCILAFVVVGLVPAGLYSEFTVMRETVDQFVLATRLFRSIGVMSESQNQNVLFMRVIFKRIFGLRCTDKTQP